MNPTPILFLSLIIGLAFVETRQNRPGCDYWVGVVTGAMMVTLWWLFQ